MLIYFTLEYANLEMSDCAMLCLSLSTSIYMHITYSYFSALDSFCNRITNMWIDMNATFHIISVKKVIIFPSCTNCALKKRCPFVDVSIVNLNSMSSFCHCTLNQIKPVQIIQKPLFVFGPGVRNLRVEAQRVYSLLVRWGKEHQPTPVFSVCYKATKAF